MAFVAFCKLRYRDIFFSHESSIFHGNFHVIPQVSALLGASSPRGASAEKPVKDVPEVKAFKIAEIKTKIRSIKAPCSRSFFESLCIPELVILGSFFITENCSCL